MMLEIKVEPNLFYVYVFMFYEATRPGAPFRDTQIKVFSVLYICSERDNSSYVRYIKVSWMLSS